MYSLELSYLYLQNNLGGILIGIALSLYIREGNGNLLPSPIYRLHAIPIKIPIYKFEENRVYYVDLQSKWFILPLSCSSLISFISFIDSRKQFSNEKFEKKKKQQPQNLKKQKECCYPVLQR